MDRVTTKTKHPGRVAQGHKLVALNRERKAALKEQPEQQPAQQSQASTVVYGGGALAILILASGALYLYTRRATPATPSTPVNSSALDNKIFRMH